MPMGLFFPTIGAVTLRQGAHEYTNCHEFTRDVIVAIYERAPVPVKNQIDRLLGAHSIYNFAHFDAANLAQKYAQIIRLPPPQATVFTQRSCATLSEGRLIIFAFRRVVQHSMFVTAPNQWTGANNLGSLAGTDTHDATVYTYDRMSIRQYGVLPAPQGGWDGTNTMRSATGDTYTMYHIPIL